MAQIDSSIYLQQQAPDLVGGFERGMNMRQMVDERTKKRAVEDAYRQGTVANPDGSTSFDQAKTMSALAKADPKEAMAFQHQNQSLAAEKQKLDQAKQAHIIDMIGRVAPTINDQATWEQGLDTLSKANIDVSNLPKAYDPKIVAGYARLAISPDKQQEFAYKDRESGFKQKELGLKREDNGLKREQVMMSKDDKDAAALDTHLAKGWTARSGQAGKVQELLNTAERAEQLLEQAKQQKGGLDQRQAREMATITNKLLGGSDAVSQVDHLLPHTWYGGAMSMEEALTNRPVGAGLQEFTDRLGETIAREKAVAQKQMRQYQIEGLPAHSGFAARNPKLYNKILQSKGITPDMIDEKGRYKDSKDVGGEPKQSLAGQTLKTHEIDWAD